MALSPYIQIGQDNTYPTTKVRIYLKDLSATSSNPVLICAYYGTSPSPTTYVGGSNFVVYNSNSELVRCTVGGPGNSGYYFRAASWTASDQSDIVYSSDKFWVTYAQAPTVTLMNTTKTSVELQYEAVADGGYYDKEIQYSLDDGTTWVTGATITGGDSAVSSYTITGLTPGTSYTIKTRVHTTAGSNNGTTIFARTVSDPKIYGSAGGVSREVSKLYGSVNGETKLIKKVYGSLNDLTQLVYSA